MLQLQFLLLHVVSFWDLIYQLPQNKDFKYSPMYILIKCFYNALQLPFVFFPRPDFSRSPLLWISIPDFENTQYCALRRWVQLFPRYSYQNWCKGWHLHFYKTYDHQIWEESTSSRVASFATNLETPIYFRLTYRLPMAS